MNHPRLYHTLRARFEASERFVDRGKTAEASDLNQLTITEAIIEILATLQEISESLQILAGVSLQPGIASNPKFNPGEARAKIKNPKPVPPKEGA